MTSYGFGTLVLLTRTAVARSVVRSLCVIPVVRILIDTWRSSNVDPVVEFLRANGGENIVGTKKEGGWYGTGTVEADVSLGLIRDISGVTGVKHVEEVKVTSKVPGGPVGSPGGSVGPGLLYGAVMDGWGPWARGGLSRQAYARSQGCRLGGNYLYRSFFIFRFCLSRETCVTLLGQDLREIAGQGVADHVANVFHVGNIETIISGERLKQRSFSD